MNRTETEVRNLRIQEALQEQLKLPLLFYVLTLTARLVFRFCPWLHSKILKRNPDATQMSKN